MRFAASIITVWYFTLRHKFGIAGGKQCSTKDELILVKKQLSSLHAVTNCLLELSSQYQLDSVSGRYLSHSSENIEIFWSYFLSKISFLFCTFWAEMALLLCLSYITVTYMQGY